MKTRTWRNICGILGIIIAFTMIVPMTAFAAAPTAVTATYSNNAVNVSFTSADLAAVEDSAFVTYILYDITAILAPAAEIVYDNDFEGETADNATHGYDKTSGVDKVGHINQLTVADTAGNEVAVKSGNNFTFSIPVPAMAETDRIYTDKLYAIQVGGTGITPGIAFVRDLTAEKPLDPSDTVTIDMILADDGSDEAEVAEAAEYNAPVKFTVDAAAEADYDGTLALQWSKDAGTTWNDTAAELKADGAYKLKLIGQKAPATDYAPAELVVNVSLDMDLDPASFDISEAMPVYEVDEPVPPEEPEVPEDPEVLTEEDEEEEPPVGGDNPEGVKAFDLDKSKSAFVLDFVRGYIGEFEEAASAKSAVDYTYEYYVTDEADATEAVNTVLPEVPAIDSAAGTFDLDLTVWADADKWEPVDDETAPLVNDDKFVDVLVVVKAAKKAGDAAVSEAYAAGVYRLNAAGTEAPPTGLELDYETENATGFYLVDEDTEEGYTSIEDADNNAGIFSSLFSGFSIDANSIARVKISLSPDGEAVSGEVALYFDVDDDDVKDADELYLYYSVARDAYDGLLPEATGLTWEEIAAMIKIDADAEAVPTVMYGDILDGDDETGMAVGEEIITQADVVDAFSMVTFTVNTLDTLQLRVYRVLAADATGINTVTQGAVVAIFQSVNKSIEDSVDILINGY